MMQNIKGRAPYVPGQKVRIGWFANGFHSHEGLAVLNVAASDLQGSGCQFWSITFLDSGDWSFRWIWPPDVVADPAQLADTKPLFIKERGTGI